MSIIKIGPKVKFTTLSNQLINDPSLSPEELGMMAYLLSKPEDWIVRPTQLADRFGMGKDRAYRILRELIDKGWIKNSGNKTPEGKFTSVEYIVLSEKPDTENPDTEITDTRNAYPTKEREELKTERRPAARAARKTAFPEGFTLERARQLVEAQRLSPDTVKTNFLNFRDHARGTGRLMADWDAAWRMWCRKSREFAPKPNGASNPRYAI